MTRRNNTVPIKAGDRNKIECQERGADISVPEHAVVGEKVTRPIAAAITRFPQRLVKMWS